MGPVEVLLPYLVKNDLGGSARDLGMVFAAGGLGSVVCALAHGPAGHARAAASPSSIVVWTLATLAVAGYGLGEHPLAADARRARLQRARDRRHDRVGDD